MFNHLEIKIKSSNNNQIITIPINIIDSEKDAIMKMEPEGIQQENSYFYLIFNDLTCEMSELKGYSEIMISKQKEIKNEIENTYSKVEISISKISTIDEYYDKSEEICMKYYFNGYVKETIKCLNFIITIKHTFPPTLPPPPLINTDLPSLPVETNKEKNKIIIDSITTVQSVNKEAEELQFKVSIKNHVKIENTEIKTKENDQSILPHATPESTLIFITTIINETSNIETNNKITFTESHSIKMEEIKIAITIESGTNVDFRFNKLNLQFSVSKIRRRSLNDEESKDNEDKENKYSMRLFGDLNNVTIENAEINIYMKRVTNEIVIKECGIFSSLSNSKLKNIKLKFLNNIRFDCNENSTINGLISGRSENVTFENVEIEFYKDNMRTIAIENEDGNTFGMISGESSNIKIVNCHVFGDIMTIINNGNNSDKNSSIFGGLIGKCEDNCEIMKSYIQVNNILLYQSMIFGGLVGSMDDESELEIIDSFVYIEDGLRIGVDKNQSEFIYGSFIGDTNDCKEVMIDNSWTIFITMGIEINTSNTNFGGMIGRVGEINKNNTIIITNSSIQMPIGHNTFIFRKEINDEINKSPNIGFIFGTNITNIESYKLDYTMSYVESCDKKSNCISPQMYYQPNGKYPSDIRRILRPNDNNYCSGSGCLSDGRIYGSLEGQGNEFCNGLGRTTCEGYNGICYDPFSYSPCKLPKDKSELILSKERIEYPSSQLICPNNCFSNGVCVFGKCLCFPGYTSYDCRLRSCPYGNPISNPSNEYEKDKRVTYECSNQGRCNRDNGLCECYSGFEGNACQRMKCPNECSNHGICMTINEAELNKENNENEINYLKKYVKWDKDSIQVCVCDKEYSGVDCSYRKCPYGYLGDSECDSLPQSEITITYTSSNIIPDNKDKIYVKYTDPFGRKWFSKSFSINSREEWLNAFGSLPPDSISIEDISVDDKSKSNTIIISITFSKHQTGRQYPIEIIGSKEMKEIFELKDKENGYYNWINPKLEDILNTEEGKIEYEMDYTQRSSECSNNGICDSVSGICKCFDGFKGIACGEINEIY